MKGFCRDFPGDTLHCGAAYVHPFPVAKMMRKGVSSSRSSRPADVLDEEDDTRHGPWRIGIPS